MSRGGPSPHALFKEIFGTGRGGSSSRAGSARTAGSSAIGPHLLNKTVYQEPGAPQMPCSKKYLALLYHWLVVVDLHPVLIQPGPDGGPEVQTGVQHQVSLQRTRVYSFLYYFFLCDLFVYSRDVCLYLESILVLSTTPFKY